MKQQILYIHGGAAFSNYDNFLNYLKTVELRQTVTDKPLRWSGNLRADLGSDYEVYTPLMPNKENSKYEEWKIWFERYVELLRDGAILIGWSQGGMFLVRYLSENTLPIKVKALYLAATPYEYADFNGEDGGDFYAEPEAIPGIQSQIESITIYHSEDDFVVPYEHGQKLAQALPAATFVSFTDRNHFFQPNFPELIDSIKSL